MDLPPDIALIRRLRTREGSIAKPLSIATAHARLTELAEALGVEAGFSASMWKHIEAGRAKCTDRQYALMALTVDATPEQVDQVGRRQAAELMRESLAVLHAPQPAAGAASAVAERLSRLIQEIHARDDLTPEERSRMQKALEDAVDAMVASHRLQLELTRRS